MRGTYSGPLHEDERISPFDFKRLVPFPELCRDELLTWCRTNWASTANAEQITVERNENQLIYRFSTLRSVPCKIAAKLSMKFPSADFEHLFLEDGQAFAGCVYYKAGVRQDFDSESGYNIRIDKGNNFACEGSLTRETFDFLVSVFQ